MTNIEEQTKIWNGSHAIKVFVFLVVLWILVKTLSLPNSVLFVHGSLAGVFIFAAWWTHLKLLSAPVKEREIKIFSFKPASYTGVIILGLYASCAGFIFFWASFTNGFKLTFFSVFEPLLSTHAIYSTLFAPFYEELFFRAALCPLILQLFAKIDPKNSRLFWSIYFNALIFWIFHFPLRWDAWTTAINSGGIPVGPGPFLLGIVTAFIFYQDKCFWTPVMFHSMANGLGSVWALVLTNTKIFHLFYS